MLAAYGVVEKESNNLVSLGFIVSDCHREEPTLLDIVHHASMPAKT